MGLTYHFELAESEIIRHDHPESHRISLLVIMSGY